MKPRTAQILGFALQMVGAFFLFIAYGSREATNIFQWVVCIIGAVPCLAGLIINLVFWRCPNCRKMLPWRNAFAITHCPWCMEQLDD